jgi:hypothetical protein
MPFLAPIGAVLGGVITKLLVSTAISVGASLLIQAMAPKPQAAQLRDPGVSLTVQLGGDNPLSFLVGLTATAGHRTYSGSWGYDGETPNAFLVDVLEIANAPVDGLNGIYVDGERSTILTGEAHSEYGYPIASGRVGGKDHLWVKFYDGRQTAPDPYLRDRFGNHSTWPYDFDMIGNGTPYAVVTTRYNHDLWKNGTPKLLFEVRGIRCYDIRKDSTAGGSGAHRRNNPATWEWSENPYVIAYNAVFMGVYVGTEWLWGLQNLPALRLPISAWVAAMNESDRTLAAWGGQKQFTIGGEVSVDTEPAAFLEEVARSSVGRFIESAGSYKPRCGAPGTSVYSFGEADLLITDPRLITPFPGLEETHNTVEASYVEPGEAWGWKPAPTKTNAAYIAADGNRKLSAGLRFPLVSRNEQVQRLAYTYLEDGRRFRQLQASFHPITWLLEPGDVIDGTILSEGYSNKKFEIVLMSGRRTFVQNITLREIEPAVFDPPSSSKDAWSVGPIATINPPSQPATGIAFDGYEFLDDADRARRAGIIGFYQGGMDDVEFFEVLVRRPGDTLPFFEGRYAYRADIVGEASQPIFSSAFLPDSNVEVSGRYKAYSNRETEWSRWMSVRIPNVKLSADDIAIDLSNVAKDVLDQMGLKPRQLIEMFKQFGTLLEEVDRENYTKREALFREISVELEGLEASFTEIIEVALGPGGAIATALESLYASMGGNTAEVNVRWTAQAAPTGYSARYAIQAAVNDGTFRAATLFLDVPADPLQPTRIGLMAGQTAFFTSTGVPIALVTEDGLFRSANNAVQINMLNGDFSFG